MKLNLKDIKPIEWAIGGTIALLTFFLLIKFVFSKKNIKLKKLADEDLKKWKGKKETDAIMSDTLINYWKTVGLNFKPGQMQSSSFQKSYPWSASYVTHLIKNSGYNFKGGTTHSEYAVKGKKDRKEKTKNTFWAFRKSENKPIEVGDILIKNRDGGKYNYDTITSGVKSHGDVIVDIKNISGKKVAYYQGGNLSNSVDRKKIDLSSNGTLTSDSPYFLHLKYIN